MSQLELVVYNLYIRSQVSPPKLDEFLNFRLSKADRIKLEVVASGRSLGSTLRELIDEEYKEIMAAAGELARLRAKRDKLRQESH